MAGGNPYGRTIKQTASPRDTEYRLLAQVTSALIDAEKNIEAAQTDPRLMSKVADALNWNKQVWDVFVEDAGSEGNGLPQDLRAAIVSLGIWVTKETAIALDKDGDIGALIAVNKNIMQGLKPAASQSGGLDANQTSAGSGTIPDNI